MFPAIKKSVFFSFVLYYIFNPQIAFAGNKLLIVNGTIISMKANDTNPYIGYVLVDDEGKLKTVGKGSPAKDITAKSTYDATGQYILPGFISGHSHLSESAFRGLATNQHVYEYPSMSGWVGALWKRENKTMPEDYYWFTLQGSLDHLVHGITSVYNFTYSKNDEVGFAEAQWRGMRGSGMIWNPMSNGRLASGIADIPKYRQLGIKIGMGVDGQGSADLPDPFENMRTGLYTIRAKYQDAKILQPIDVLRFHTIGSAEVLGIDDKVGSLETGKYADIVVIDTHLAERGPVIDPYAAIVLACNSMNIAKVYVGGELMVDHYQLQKSNMAAVSKEVTNRVAKLN